MKIGLFGIGSMGSAILKGLKLSFPGETFWIADHNQNNLEIFPDEHVCHCPNELIEKVDIVILSIKEKSLKPLVDKITTDTGNKIFISVMAGVPIDRIMELTQSKKVVRAMPNLPISVGMGMIAWIASNGVIDIEKQILKKIFSSVGNELELKNERLIDLMTPISGSGPAYFFYLCNLLKEKAISYGFSNEESCILAECTFFGSAELLLKSEGGPKDLIRGVATPGGSTEEALKVFEESDFNNIFFKAIDAAREKIMEGNK